MPLTLAFGLICLTAGAGAWAAESWPVRAAAAHAGLAFGLVAAAYAGVGPRIFGKRADGRLPPWSWACFLPYLALNWLTLVLWRRSGDEARFHVVAPGLHLGGIPGARDRDGVLALRTVGVLDLTSEFHEPHWLRSAGDYLCIPLLDTAAPDLPQTVAAVSWLTTRLRAGPVYAHCAMGHGRSAAVVAAYLIASGIAAGPEDAESRIRAVRPRAGLNRRQRALLTAYAEHLRAPSTSGGPAVPPG